MPISSAALICVEMCCARDTSSLHSGAVWSKHRGDETLDLCRRSNRENGRTAASQSKSRSHAGAAGRGVQLHAVAAHAGVRRGDADRRVQPARASWRFHAVGVGRGRRLSGDQQSPRLDQVAQARAARNYRDDLFGGWNSGFVDFGQRILCVDQGLVPDCDLRLHLPWLAARRAAADVLYQPAVRGGRRSGAARVVERPVGRPSRLSRGATLVTAVWGIAYVVEAILRVGFAMVLSPAQVVSISPVMAFAVLIALISWTRRYMLGLRERRLRKQGLQPAS